MVYYAAKYLEALEDLRKAGAFGWVMLMVTDVLKGHSVLLSSRSKYEKRLPYIVISDHVYDLQGILSRKKQLLPEILHAVNVG